MYFSVYFFLPSLINLTKNLRLNRIDQHYFFTMQHKVASNSGDALLVINIKPVINYWKQFKQASN